MARQKYKCASKKEVEFTILIGELLSKKEVVADLPFVLYGGAFNKYSVYETRPENGMKVSPGILIERLSDALREVEQAFYLITGEDYSAENARRIIHRLDIKEGTTWRGNSFDGH